MDKKREIIRPINCWAEGLKEQGVQRWADTMLSPWPGVKQKVAPLDDGNGPLLISGLYEFSFPYNAHLSPYSLELNPLSIERNFLFFGSLGFLTRLASVDDSNRSYEALVRLRKWLKEQLSDQPPGQRRLLAVLRVFTNWPDAWAPVFESSFKWPPKGALYDLHSAVWLDKDGTVRVVGGYRHIRPGFGPVTHDYLGSHEVEYPTDNLIWFVWVPLARRLRALASCLRENRE